MQWILTWVRAVHLWWILRSVQRGEAYLEKKRKFTQDRRKLAREKTLVGFIAIYKVGMQHNTAVLEVSSSVASAYFVSFTEDPFVVIFNKHSDSVEVTMGSRFDVQQSIRACEAQVRKGYVVGTFLTIGMNFESLEKDGYRMAVCESSRNAWTWMHWQEANYAFSHLPKLDAVIH